MGGKAAKAWSCGDSGSVLVKWPPLWRPCLPKIYRGGPEHTYICSYSLGSLGMQWVNHAVPCINQALQQIKENSLENVRPVLEGQAKISTPRSPWLGLA